jgi:hypothetical protein
MDTLGVLNHLSGVMTTKEWSEFKGTEDYLWMQARVEGYRGTHMGKLIEAGKRRREEAWVIALDMAQNIIRAEMEEIPVDVPEQQEKILVDRLAEKLMCEQGLVPPRFTKLVECQTCGPVHAPEDAEPLMPNCPWCQL